MWILPVIAALAGTTQYVPFLQFITEEAIQACSLGVYLAIQNRNNEAAWEGINLLESQLIPHLEQLNIKLGWIHPVTMGAFMEFAQASRTNVTIMSELASAKVKI